MQITQAILDQAEADAPLSGYDTSQFYHIDRTVDPTLITADLNTIENYDASVEVQATDKDGVPLVDADGNPVFVGVNAAAVSESMNRKTYRGYLSEDGIPPNGAALTAGISFPDSPVPGQFCLRKDYFPNRLFRYDGRAWRKVEDNLRHTMNNLGASDTGTGDRFEGKDVRQTQRGTFVNNTAKSGINSLAVDVFVASSATSTIQTSVPYAAGMAAGVYLGEIAIDSSVSSGVGGNALITLNRTAPIGTRIQYQLYEAAVEQRQSLSKALRPKAD